MLVHRSLSVLNKLARIYSAFHFHLVVVESVQVSLSVLCTLMRTYTESPTYE